MAGRIRTVKPEILDDEKAAGLSHGAWRLWVSLFLVADDYGNFRALPQFLAGQVFWAHPKADVAVMLGELEEAGLIRRYSVRGQDYATIPNWSKHQRVEKPGKPRCPDPSEAIRETPENILETPEKVLGSLQPDPDLRPRPTTTDQDQRPPTVAEGAVAPSVSSQIQTVWQAYREKHPRCPGTLGSKRKEYRLVKERLADGYSVQDLIQAIEGYHASPWHQGKNDRGTKYDSLDLIMRDGGHVQKGIEMAEDPTIGYDAGTKNTMQSLASWAEKRGTA